MAKEAAATALRSLAEGTGNRSEAARLRDLLPDIEATLQAGVKRSAVLEALHAQGFTMTMKGFENTLYRLRKEKTKALPATIVIQQKTQELAAPASKTESPKQEGTHHQQEIEIEPENLDGLTAKQRREIEANKYIPADGPASASAATRKLLERKTKS